MLISRFLEIFASSFQFPGGANVRFAPPPADTHGTLWFRRFQCLVKRSVLSVFINLRSAECVCLYYGLRVWPQINKLNNNIIIKKISQILERAQTKNRGPFEARKLKMGSPILHTPYTHKDHYCTRNLRGDSSTLGFNQHKIAVAIYRN